MVNRLPSIRDVGFAQTSPILDDNSQYVDDDLGSGNIDRTSIRPNLQLVIIKFYDELDKDGLPTRPRFAIRYAPIATLKILVEANLGYRQ